MIDYQETRGLLLDWTVGLAIDTCSTLVDSKQAFESTIRGLEKAKVW